MTVEVIIQPLSAQLDYTALDNLRNDISREFKNIKVKVATSNNSNLIRLKKDAASQSLFDKDRNQWYSPKLLDWFFEKFRPNKNTRMLFMLDVDAYSNGLNFVLGEASPKEGIGAIYLPRLKQEFYGLKPDNELFYERMVKEAVHELGHVFDFVHCPITECVMHFSNSLNDTDTKGKGFCTTCRMKRPIF
jgi:archaemetzincin